MITCKCGKAIEKVPDWFQAVQVEFICNNCPNRRQKHGGLGADASPNLPNMSIGEGVEKIADEEED
ncbi:MAG: hypothetical protein KF784_05560 [Fimbriimonadaceae bacterium]|nr:hypothetical protein [Fimbriimonadaceae bacterium]